ncbi:DNA helicase B-like [Ptychodera flava]|uniref:DNA helicase B-like n=1 Tax=Ptychodera flava TaxID=63121 RepID=UPI00396A9DF4
MSRGKGSSYETITGRLILNPQAKDDEDFDEDEDDEGDDEIQWLDSREMEGLARGASLIKASGLPTKNVSVKPHGTDRKVTVQGRFPLCGPWWEAEIKVSKTKGPVRFMVKLPFYKLCQDSDVSTVSLFLTQGCDIDNINVKTFIDTMYQNGVKLNFRNLEDALDQYGGLKEEYQESAQEIKSRIHKTGEGRCMLRALKFPNLVWYLPNLLPKKAYNLLTGLKDEKLELLEEAIRETPWVFGFSPTLWWEYNLVGCEASVDALNYCNLLSKMPSYIQDALYIYHVMKSDCRRFGHTFLYENSMKKSQAFQGYHVKEWEEAYKFLEEKYIIVRDRGNRIYLRKYWKYEQQITDNLASLQSLEGWRINFDWQNHPDFKSDAAQKEAARMICENPITVISGKGGCGKTHVVSTVFEEAAKEFLHIKNDAEQKGEGNDGLDGDEEAGQGSGEGDKKKNKKKGTILSKPYILLTAPTGKAASLLGRRSRLPSFTLHQVMFSFYSYIRRKNDPTFTEEWKFKVVRALIVDECSLVSIEVFTSVLDILMRESELCKIVFLGDIKQLPSIDPGNFLSDLYRSYSTIGWSISLLTNHRAESALIVDNATRIAKQQQPHFDSASGFHDVRIRGCDMDETYDATVLSTTLEEEESFEVDDAIRALLKQEDPSLKDHERSQFIAFKRKDCERINEICCMHYSGHPTRNSKKRLDFRKGDKVCMTRNAEVFNMIIKKDVRLCNGEIFFIEDYVDKINERNQKTAEVTLREGERTLRVDFREVRKKCKVKHSWARTIHTYQGSESETVVYVVGRSILQNWQHVYTAVTRGKNQVYIVSSPWQLSKAIDKKPHMRNTRLYELLAAKLRGRGGVKVSRGQSSSDVIKGHSSMLVQSAMPQNGTSSYGKPYFTDNGERSDTNNKAICKNTLVRRLVQRFIIWVKSGQR